MVYRSMNERIKTSIIINKKLWDRFRHKISVEKNLKSLSKSVEEALEEELNELIIAEALEKMISAKPTTLETVPVKLKVKGKAEEVVRELRGSRT